MNMATEPKQSKPGSRWGSFLQQAVAGVESKLDNILADGEQSGTGSTTTATQPGMRQSMSMAPPSIPGGTVDSALPSRTPSNAKTNDRLQERLAKAMVKNKPTSEGGSVTSSQAPSRTPTPALASDSPRTSLDRHLDVKESISENGSNNDAKGASSKDSDGLKSRLSPPSADHAVFSRSSIDSHTSVPSRESLDNGLEQADNTISSTSSNGHGPSRERVDHYKEMIRQLKSDFETSELRRQEEIHTHMERIDALQAKLQYLARGAAQSAKSMADSAASGSAERKLAEKDEQIALLMEEGQNLSKTELKHLTIIKKLRGKSQEDERALAEAKWRQERAEKSISSARDKINRAEAAEKRANDRLKTLAKIEKDVDAFQSERETNSAKIASLTNQLTQVTTRATEAEKKAQNEALEIERRLTQDLRDDLSNTKIEKELLEERLRAEIRQIKDSAERDKERAKAMELELRGEQSVLESKLEVLRARAEEVSSGATGDAQAKLLRQIETLQTQYSVASENWQGIESSMQSRLTSLERERDEASKKESDVRRKAREVNLKAKRVEQDLDTSRATIETLNQDMQDTKTQLTALQSRLKASEDTLAALHNSHANERAQWEAALASRIEEERMRLREEFAEPHRLRTDSPTASMRKAPHAEFLNLPPRRSTGRTLSAESPVGETSNGFRSRRQSTQHLPPRTPETGTPQRQDSLSNIAGIPIGTSVGNGTESETPSIHPPDNDYFEGVISPHSPNRTINDMISVSTSAAGPSVQLVERMSAAVRRLESEKAVRKEELARLSAQRDEAREEVVNLMREVEQKRQGDEKISKLEREMEELRGRYETTLEMLGEKSELVEELKADVVDIKKMYRELIDSTMK